MENNQYGYDKYDGVYPVQIGGEDGYNKYYTNDEIKLTAYDLWLKMRKTDKLAFNDYCDELKKDGRPYDGDYYDWLEDNKKTREYFDEWTKTNAPNMEKLVEFIRKEKVMDLGTRGRYLQEYDFVTRENNMWTYEYLSSLTSREDWEYFKKIQQEKYETQVKAEKEEWEAQRKAERREEFKENLKKNIESVKNKLLGIKEDLKMYHYDFGGNEEYAKSFIEVFKEKHPNIEIKGEWLEENNKCKNVIISSSKQLVIPYSNAKDISLIDEDKYQTKLTSNLVDFNTHFYPNSPDESVRNSVVDTVNRYIARLRELNPNRIIKANTEVDRHLKGGWVNKIISDTVPLGELNRPNDVSIVYDKDGYIGFGGNMKKHTYAIGKDGKFKDSIDDYIDFPVYETEKEKRLAEENAKQKTDINIEEIHPRVR